MKKKINQFHREIEYRLKRLCGQPSPKKRLVTVLVIGVVLAVANIWFLVSSIYNIGKNDAEKELMKLQHTCTEQRRSIERLELQKKNKDFKDFKNLKENKENDE